MLQTSYVEKLETSTNQTVEHLQRNTHIDINESIQHRKAY